jgi:hypothetical protein
MTYQVVLTVPDSVDYADLAMALEEALPEDVTYDLRS